MRKCLHRGCPAPALPPPDWFLEQAKDSPSSYKLLAPPARCKAHADLKEMRERRKRADYKENKPLNTNIRKWQKYRLKDFQEKMDLYSIFLALEFGPKFFHGLTAKQVGCTVLKSPEAGKALEGAFFKLLEKLERMGKAQRRTRKRDQSGMPTTYWSRKVATWEP